VYLLAFLRFFCCQDLPFQYRFAYMAGNQENPLTSGFQSSNSLRDFTLPSNPSIVAVVYVRDSFGGEARSSLSADRVINTTVSVEPVPAAQVTAVLAASLQSLVLDALAQGNIASSMAAVGNMAQVAGIASCVLGSGCHGWGQGVIFAVRL
jgi:hypothetical protein